jgi:acyl carrier protein phosphodiesterase
MNFLAHIHIADYCGSSIAGNLLGDFVKGDPGRDYPVAISNGIRLHRFVDSFTDSHSAMTAGKSYFSQELRRFAPIALDMFWDHCLARSWSDYHTLDLSDFCRLAEERARGIDVAVPERYSRVTERMWSGRWLESYQDLAILEVALARMSQRSLRMRRLADCFAPLQNNYSDLLLLFPPLYQDVLRMADKYSRGLTKSG